MVNLKVGYYHMDREKKFGLRKLVTESIKTALKIITKIKYPLGPDN